MNWELRFSKKADKQLSKLDPRQSRIIVAWLLKNIYGCKDPRVHGKALSADQKGMWRYRIGNYRVLVEISDKELVVLAIQVGHRKDIYEIR